VSNEELPVQPTLCNKKKLRGGYKEDKTKTLQKAQNKGASRRKRMDLGAGAESGRRSGVSVKYRNRGDAKYPRKRSPELLGYFTLGYAHQQVDTKKERGAHSIHRSEERHGKCFEKTNPEELRSGHGKREIQCAQRRWAKGIRVRSSK